jgi:hypothetical protein
MSRRTPLAYGALGFLAAFALFYHLDDRLLWGDEAETALLAKNVTKFGVPKATDGKNYVTLLGAGRDSNEDDIWIWSPWLDEYATAASFLVLGETTFAARLPFALAALVSVLAFAAVTHRIYRSHEISLVATALLVTNVPFLLHARQCRYYALVILAQIGLIYGYHLLVTGERKRAVWFLALSLTAQFYCNYVVVLGNVLGLGLATLASFRKSPGLFRAQLVTLAGFVAMAGPWIAYAKPWRQSEHSGPEDFFTNLAYYLSEIHFHILPLFVLLLGIVFFRRWRSSRSPSEVLLWTVAVGHLFVLGMAPEIRYIRYILVLVPGVILLGAVMLVTFVRPRPLRHALVAILCLSNAASVLTAYPWRGGHDFEMPLVRFAREITSRYEDRLEDVVAYLRANASAEESLFALDPEFPLIFYTDMRVIDGRLSALDRDAPPDWILTESASGLLPQRPLRLPEDFDGLYQPVHLSVPNSPRQGSRPAPDVHASFTNPNRTRFTVLRRRR